MAMLFWQHESAAWEACWLDASVCTLAGDGAPDIRGDAATGNGVPVPMLRLSVSELGERWVLLAGGDAHVCHNGSPLSLGLAVLADRDGVQVVDASTGRRQQFYFSTERLAQVTPLPDGLSVVCPRCKQPIETASLAVRCPGCGVWHHQLSDRPCWTYADLCGACSVQETSLEGRPRWSPEEL